jgi:hypothetical protein
VDVEDYLAERGVTSKGIVDQLVADGWRVEGSWVVIPWRDAGGEVVYESRRALNGGTPKYKNDRGTRPPLWASPRAREGAGSCTLAEGVFDVLAVLEAVGVPGFAAFGVELSDEAADELAAHERVVLFPDTDEAGRRLVEHARLKLARRTDLRVATYPAKDVAELIVSGGADAVASAWSAAEQLSPVYTSWAPVDAAAILAGELVEEPPRWLKRTDGQKLLYAGKMHSFSGEPESGKTWAALLAAAEAIEEGRDVLYVDFEDSPFTVLSRMRDLGVADDLITTRFHYVRPTEPLTEAAWLDLEPILARGPALVVLDGVSEAMVLHGLELERNSDVAAFIALLPRRLAATGAATVWIDHVVKDRDARRRYSIGAQHKLAGLDGAAYVFEPLSPFGGDVDGASTVSVMKDRAGFVRSYSLNRKTVGPFRLLASGSPMRAEIGVPTAAWDSATGLSGVQSRVLAALPDRDAGTRTWREIGDTVAGDGQGPPLKRSTIHKALEDLTEAGLADADQSETTFRWWKT